MPEKKSPKADVDLLEYSKMYNEALKTENRLGGAYKAVQEEYALVIKTQTRIFEKMIIEGETEQNAKAVKILEKEKKKHDKLSEKARKAYEASQEITREMSVEYDRRIDNYGRRLVITNTIFVVSLISFVISAGWLCRIWIPTITHNIESLFSRMSPSFYEACLQLIIALTIALYIGTKRGETKDNRPWWNYSKFATGTTWALVGIIACLFVLAISHSSIYAFAIVVTSTVILLISALSPLARSAREL